jgi:hypothetical protein
MKWEDALKLLEKGRSLKRTDCGFYTGANIQLLEHEGQKYFYMNDKYYNSGLELYAVTYQDLISDCWEVIQ